MKYQKSLSLYNHKLKLIYVLDHIKKTLDILYEKIILILSVILT